MVSPVLSAPPLPELDFETMPAEEVLRWAHAEFGEKLCLTCSWQKQSSVLVHMVAELGLDIPVIELDTHLFFRESYETRDRLVERYGIRLLPPPPLMTVAEQHRRVDAPAKAPLDECLERVHGRRLSVHQAQSPGRGRQRAKPPQDFIAVGMS